MPRWDTSWITPAEETTIHVSELLPAGLVLNDDTSAFVMTIDPVEESWSLAQFCAGCPAVTTVAPKPAFTGTVSTTGSLSASVQSVDLESGSFQIELTNGFAFDPLRPGVASDSGSITISVFSGATAIASLVVDGREEAFGPGATLPLELAFNAPVVADDLRIELTVDSPAGDATSLDPNDALSMTVTSDDILVSEATIAVGGQSIAGVDAELDMEDVDLESVKDGTILLDVENPFGVGGDLTMTIDPAGDTPIVKAIELPASDTTVALDFSEDEMQRLMGTVSTMSVGGTLEPANVTVTPDMSITIAMRLRVTVEIGGNNDEGDDD